MEKIHSGKKTAGVFWVPGYAVSSKIANFSHYLNYL